MPNGKLATRDKILQVVEGMELAGSLMTISGVAKEAGLSNSTIHNRYPDLAERIRASAGVVQEKDVKTKLAQRLGTIKEEKAKRARVREELEVVKALLRKVNSVNSALQFEIESLKSQLAEERQKYRTQVVNIRDTLSHQS
jgi:AcrR family transcriptional regulator